MRPTTHPRQIDHAERSGCETRRHKHRKGIRLRNNVQRSSRAAAPKRVRTSPRSKLYRLTGRRLFAWLKTWLPRRVKPRARLTIPAFRQLAARLGFHSLFKRINTLFKRELSHDGNKEK